MWLLNLQVQVREAISFYWRPTDFIIWSLDPGKLKLMNTEIDEYLILYCFLKFQS